jgi:uncharacterized protein
MIFDTISRGYYHRAVMSEQASIDGLKFARERGQLAGEMEVADMPRLQDMLAEGAGRVGYAVAGLVDDRGRPALDVAVQGTIPLICQRCLERLDFELERASRLVLVADSSELPDVSQEEPDSETIPAAEVADVRDLVEQEVLLGLPLAPVHEEGCIAAPASPGQAEESPFAVLKTLKRS